MTLTKNVGWNFLFQENAEKSPEMTIFLQKLHDMTKHSQKRQEITRKTTENLDVKTA